MSKSFKVLVIGDNNVGKTSICKRYVHYVFSDYVKKTNGLDNFLKSIFYSNQRINIIFWDISGQEHNIKFYKDVSFGLIVFSLINRKSFNNIGKWKRIFDKNVKGNNGKPIPSILIANKADIPDIEVSDDEIRKTCVAHDFLAWFKISAKENYQIDKVVGLMLKELTKK